MSSTHARSKTASDQLTRSGKEYASRNLDLLKALPHPDETWETHETDLESNHIEKLQNVSIIERVGTVNARTNDIGIYRTRQAAFEYIEDATENRDELPCGHSGFRHLHSGEFTCGFDNCDQRFGREQVEEVYGGGGR